MISILKIIFNAILIKIMGVKIHQSTHIYINPTDEYIRYSGLIKLGILSAFSGFFFSMYTSSERLGCIFNLFLSIFQALRESLYKILFLLCCQAKSSKGREVYMPRRWGVS
ncbi:hypothetical protein FKM82_024526 [Ascaphus truei]